MTYDVMQFFDWISNIVILKAMSASRPSGNIRLVDGNSQWSMVTSPSGNETRPDEMGFVFYKICLKLWCVKIDKYPHVNLNNHIASCALQSKLFVILSFSTCIEYKFCFLKISTKLTFQMRIVCNNFVQ